jgi:hypothetical protein
LSVSAAALRTEQPQSNTWINGRSWDLTFIVFSCVLVFVTYGLYSSGVQRLVVNMLVTLLVGGPHMFSTYTRTAMEPTFIRRYGLLFVGAITLIPAFVITVGLVYFTLLLTVFFTVASIHVAEQFSFVAAAYARKAGQTVTRFSRVLDASVILLSLHMPAAYLLVRGEFAIGDRHLLFPSFLQHEWLWYPVVFVWAVVLVTFLARTANELMIGQVNLPKLLFLGIAIPIALYVPTRENLDVSFQGMNAWHSFQYLALIWFISRMRHDGNQVSFGFVRQLTRPGGFPAFYGFCLGLTVASGVLIMALSRVVGFDYEQAYYLVVLSFLLVHYAFDHLLFTDLREIVPEDVKPAA